MTDSRSLLNKLDSFRNLLRDDRVGVLDYIEQLACLLFLKMAHERATRKLKPQQIVPEEYSWQPLLDAEGVALEIGCGRAPSDRPATRVTPALGDVQRCQQRVAHHRGRAEHVL